MMLCIRKEIYCTKYLEGGREEGADQCENVATTINKSNLFSEHRAFIRSDSEKKLQLPAAYSIYLLRQLRHAFVNLRCSCKQYLSNE